jgi:hypothetical protein
MTYKEAFAMVQLADEEGKVIKAHGPSPTHELTLEQVEDWLLYERDRKSTITIDGNLIKFNNGIVWISITDAETEGDK